MNREIKFRVWDKINKKWELGLGTFIFKSYFNFNENKQYVIQQFTGLKDDLGKEIYEGDIIKCSGGKFGLQICDIQYHAPGFTLSIYPQEKFSFAMDMDWRGFKVFEIIGNIFENKNE